MTRVLMLDVDGVLLSDARPWVANLEADLGLSPTMLQARFFKKHWHKIIVGEADIESVLALVLEQLGAKVSAADVLTYWFSHDARVEPSVLADVDDLRVGGWKVFLATNQEHARAAYLMQNLGLKAHVDGIAYSARLGARKPDAAYFREAQKLTGGANDAHLLVDDTQANVKAARKFGWSAQHWEPQMRLRHVVNI